MPGGIRKWSRPLRPLHLRQRSFDAGEPERHLHSTVQLYSSGQLGSCLWALANPGIQGAETAVAVGLEWTHAQFISQGESLAVMGCSLGDV
jgi:hypothetical protein